MKTRPQVAPELSNSALSEMSLDPRDPPVVLPISEDGSRAIVGSASVPLSDVAGCLRALHKFGVAVLQEGSSGRIPVTR